MFKLFILFVIFSTIQCSTTDESKVVIDNDAGGDDSMAIFLMLLYQKYFNGSQLIALTTGNGNTNEDNVYVNNQKLLKLAGRQDIPIFRGSKTALVKTPVTNNYYGLDGMGDAGDNFTDLVPAKEQTAALALIEMSKLHQDQMIIITIGTLTNVALALKLDPDFLKRIRHLYVGAGHIHDEHNPKPEFNAEMDVEAYHIVTNHASPDKVTVFPFSQTKSSIKLPKSWRLEVLGAIESDIIKAQNNHEQVSLARPGPWNALDPSVVAVALKEDLVNEYRYSKNSIYLCGSNRGLNINSFVPKDKANVRMVYSVNQDEYVKFLLDVFAHEK